MKDYFTKRGKIFGIFLSAALGLILLVLVGAIEVQAGRTCGCTIESAITVSPPELSYGTVFPEEVLFEPVNIAMSETCLRDHRLDDVEYRIVQQVKPRDPKNSSYCQSNPSDLSKCYPLLCPYLSKEPDNSPPNDQGVSAFHDMSASSSIAYGRLAKSENDTQDQWNIDLHVPCFKGECAQDNIVPPVYEADPSLEGQVFGCDLKVVVDKLSYFPREKEGTIGFWRNWNRHNTYTQSQINGWLGTINTSSSWLMNDHNSDLGVTTTYSINTSGMVQLINDSTGCVGSTRRCAALKFKAQYLALRLNIPSGRKSPNNTYNISALDSTNYLGLGSGNVSLASIISAIEFRAAGANGTNPTRPQLLIMQSVANFINNQGI